jgi:hypothetical protein
MQTDALHPKIIEILTELEISRAWHAFYDIRDRMMVRYQMGQGWRLGWDGGGNAVGKPPMPNKESLHITPNMLSPVVRQWCGRMNVTDWSSQFNALRDDDPGVHLTARQMSSYFDQWHEPAMLPDHFRDSVFKEVVIGTAAMTAYWDDDAPGGLRIEKVWSHRITTDPSVTSELLENHPYVIDSQVLPVSLLRRILKAYLPENDEIYNTDATMEQMMSGESYLGRALYQLQPGIGMSKTKALVLHRRFSNNFKQVTYALQNPMPSDPEKGKPDYLRTTERPPPNTWKLVVADKEWLYGNILLKLDLFDNIISSVGIGLVSECVPIQDIISLCKKHGLRTMFTRSSLRIIAEPDSILNPDVFKQNIEGAIIQMKPGAMSTGKHLPQAFEMPKVDMSTEKLEQAAMTALSFVSGGANSPVGEMIRSGQPYSAIELLINQGLTPIITEAEQNRVRTNRWINNIVRMGVDRMARCRTKEFVEFIGVGLSSPSLAKIASKTVLNGQTKCSIRPASWLAETPQQIYTRLWAALQAGRIEWDEFVVQYYDLTKREFRPGQDEANQQAHEAVRRTLLGEKLNVPPLVDYATWKYVISRYLGRSLTAEYTDAQQAALYALYDKCEKGQLALNLHKGAQQTAANPQGESPGGGAPPSAGTEAPGAAPTPDMAGAP